MSAPADLRERPTAELLDSLDRLMKGQQRILDELRRREKESSGIMEPKREPAIPNGIAG